MKGMLIKSKPSKDTISIITMNTIEKQLLYKWRKYLYILEQLLEKKSNTLVAKE